MGCGNCRKGLLSILLQWSHIAGWSFITEVLNDRSHCIYIDVHIYQLMGCCIELKPTWNVDRTQVTCHVGSLWTRENIRDNVQEQSHPGTRSCRPPGFMFNQQRTDIYGEECHRWHINIKSQECYFEMV